MYSAPSILTSITAAVALTLGMPSSSWADAPIPVVATFSVLGDMVKRIGGEHISLTTLVGADGDTHVYQPTPQAARVVAEADAVVAEVLVTVGEAVDAHTVVVHLVEPSGNESAE